MCGLAAYLGPGEAAPTALAALARMARLGRDSAGLAAPAPGGFAVRRELGGAPALAAPAAGPPAGGCIIAHVREATVGAATLANAHPLLSADGQVVVAHAGLVENHVALRAELAAAGVACQGGSDSEVLPHLLAGAYAAARGDALAALRAVLPRLTGGFAFLALFSGQPGRIYVVRGRTARLFIGRGRRDGAPLLAVASLPAGLPPQAGALALLGAERIAILDAGGVAVCDYAGAPVRLRFAPRWLAGPWLALRAAAAQARRLPARLRPRRAGGRR